MLNQIKKLFQSASITQTQDAGQDIATDELSQAELETISAGAVQIQDFHFTTKVDKSSPTL